MLHLELQHQTSLLRWPILTLLSTGNCFHPVPLSTLLSPLTTPFPFLLRHSPARLLVSMYSITPGSGLSAIRGPGEQTLDQILILR